MKKISKVSIGLMAGTLMALTAASAALASGWVAEGDEWYYLDSYGDPVTDTWKSYNGTYYYLGDDGAMLTNELIEDGDNYYYVDANGAMVKNTWVAIAADDDEDLDVDYRWYYFGSSGKAYRSSLSKTIDGAVYAFDEEGKMLFGFVDEAGQILTDDEGDSVLSATYYFGTNDDGARHTGWLKYEDGLDEYDDSDYDYYWFYFGSNGKKVADTTKKINGSSYSFDENGVMTVDWDVTATATTTKYYSGSLEDGSLQKNSWIRTTAPEDWDIDDDEHWFRTDGSGCLIADQTKKINSKWYVFDEYGVMTAGLVELSSDEVSGASLVQSFDLDDTTASDIYKIESGNIYFFSADEETDGSMKTGKVTISLADDDYTFGFSSSGLAYNGVVSSKLYRNGILQKASSDEKYVIAYLDADKSLAYLVNTSGTVQKAGKYYKDADDDYYVVLSGDNDAGYEIEKVSTLSEAKALLNGD